MGRQDAEFATCVFTGYRWETEETNDLIPYSHHPYAYALGDPVRYIDPTGKCVAGVVIDTVICGGLLVAGAMLVAGGVIATDPATREAAEDVARRSSQAIQNIATDASRGARYITSGDWFPEQEFFPLPTQDGRPVRLGPDLGEACSSFPEGFSQEQFDPSWWLRPGPSLDGEQPLWHTGSPLAGEPPTIILAADHGRPVRLPNGGQATISGSVSNAETFARGTGIREVQRLVDAYGGNRRNWRKRKGEATLSFPDGTIINAEVHWYEHDGIGKVELKYKRELP